MAIAQKCLVIGCEKPAIAKGLCDTHRKRVDRHGSVDAGRPKDWGSREKHPLYSVWCGLKRSVNGGLAKEWSNFWDFVKEVKKRPENTTFSVKDRTKPIGPRNWYWRVRQGGTRSIEEAEERARRAREWRRQLLIANPTYFKDMELSRRYGLPPGWFASQLKKQKGKCAICIKPETKIDPQWGGKVRSLAVDHCHETDKVRGLLCSDCNTAIAFFKHSPGLLRAAAKYLG